MLKHESRMESFQKPPKQIQHSGAAIGRALWAGTAIYRMAINSECCMFAEVVTFRVSGIHISVFLLTLNTTMDSHLSNINGPQQFCHDQEFRNGSHLLLSILSNRF